MKLPKRKDFIIGNIVRSNDSKTGKVIGDQVFINQWWCPILWDKEEDPDFCKSGCLELINKPKEIKGYYAICTYNDFEDTCDPYFLIVLKSYWDEHRCLDGRHISNKINLSSRFDEIEESNFMFDGPIKEGRDELESIGFVENLELLP